MLAHQKINCNCLAYDFPHRPGGGSCQTTAFVNEVKASGRYQSDIQEAAAYLDDHGNDLYPALQAFRIDRATPNPARFYY